MLVEIRRKLDEARGLAVCIDVFNIFCMIDLALTETNDMLYRYESAGKLAIGLQAGIATSTARNYQLGACNRDHVGDWSKLDGIPMQ